MVPPFRAAAVSLAALALGAVSDAEWESFLDSVVTPRFPAGFTVVEAEGHWRGATGVVERERTEVVTLLHPGDESSRRAVAQVAAEYLRRFRQEAVLRERLTACARFSAHAVIPRERSERGMTPRPARDHLRSE